MLELDFHQLLQLVLRFESNLKKSFSEEQTLEVVEEYVSGRYMVQHISILA